MIKFENVFFKYSNSNENVLEDINLEIKKGTWVSILGKNGSGKSTLMKLLYGQNLATDGEIFLENRIYSKEIYSNIRNKVAVVFQNPDNQFVGATVEEDIAFGLENKNISPDKMDEIIDEVLSIVDMPEYRKYEPSALSGGQKQRVAIAASLALKPEILILDEATSMLDPNAKKNILEYIKKINKTQNITIISITHDGEESVYSDSIVVLEKGKIAYQGSYEELYTNFGILEEYFLEIPFLEKIKRDLNKHLKKEVFLINENEEDVVDKLCELV
ncbi:energy-coupling factor transporter ATPase [Gemella cuniculi]|uniref:energy-coupling factor transporter ATPase n=1 Tax=Gemella cuniculi TaxID=150240 RepID=UPI0003FF8D62|nr:energy-coupling factor transporter ATPase [Gemella cuniculi]